MHKYQYDSLDHEDKSSSSHHNDDATSLEAAPSPLQARREKKKDSLLQKSSPHCNCLQTEVREVSDELRLEQALLAEREAASTATEREREPHRSIDFTCTNE